MAGAVPLRLPFVLLLLAGTRPPPGRSHVVTSAGVWNLSAAVQMREPALLRGAGDTVPPGDSLRRRWTWQHIGDALSARALGGPLTVQRDIAGLFPFFGGGALSELLPPDSPFKHRDGGATLRVDGAELPALLRGQVGSNPQSSTDDQPSWHYYFSGKIMELASGQPVVHQMQELGYELLEQNELVRPLVEVSTRLRAKGDSGSVDIKTNVDSIRRAAELQGNIWLSSGNASTPLHYDTSMNLFVQLRGRKRFWLLPPEAATILPMEPVHSPGHRQLAMRAFPVGSLEHDVGDSQCRHLLLSDESSAETSSEQALAAALPQSLVDQLRLIELGPGDVLWLPPYWLHHTVAISPRGCLSVSLWAESSPHEHLMMLLSADMPPSDAKHPPGRLNWAVLLLTSVLRALVDESEPSGDGLSCEAESAITGSRVASVLRLRYTNYMAWHADRATSSDLNCKRRVEEAEKQQGSEFEVGQAMKRFARRAAGWLSHPEANCSIRLLNLVQYAERLLPWVLGLRGDAVQHAPGSLKGQLPAYALCLADCLDNVEHMK